MADVLDAAALRRWSGLAARRLEDARTAVDAINVFPVRDADTGTNLALTLRAAHEATAGGEPGLGPTAGRLARGALVGARGNSGVILAQLLLGVAEVLAGTEHCDAERLRTALRRGSELAWAAVTRPAAGTILSVARAAAEAAATAGPGCTEVARAAADAGAGAVEAGPAQLEALARAGVVDAGGIGLLLVLDALVTALGGGEPPDRLHGLATPAPASPAGSTPQAAGYEVMYLLEAEDSAAPVLRELLEPLGDSLLVVGGGGLWNVHVHVDVAAVGPAVEAGIEVGRPHRLRVTRLADLPTGAAQDARAGRAVAALAPGGQLRALLEAEGALVVDTGVDAAPAPEAVLALVEATRAAEVVVLPNAAAAVAPARRAAELARERGVVVAVVPTRSPVQALAALAVRDAGASFGDDIVAMSSAAAGTRWGEVRVAAERALTSAGVCEPGDLLGLVDGDVSLIGRDTTAVAAGLLDRLLMAGGELVTLLVDTDDDPGAGQAGLGPSLSGYLRATRPGVEVALLRAGLAGRRLLVGVE